MFKLAVFTDEVSQDFEKAIKLALEFGLDGVEIRSVWEKPPQNLTGDDVRRMKDILSRTDLKVCCIASPFPMISPIREVFSELFVYFSRCFLLWI
jgi:sugar phosphate isomerase/epimerase